MKNIETMMKFCSKLGDIFEHPYYFNWSTPTNHRDNSPDSEIKDITYCILRVGLYIPCVEIIDGVEYEGRNNPIEKQLFFGQVVRITDFTIFNHFLNGDDLGVPRDEYLIKTFDDLEKHKEELKIIFKEYILKQDD